MRQKSSFVQLPDNVKHNISIFTEPEFQACSLKAVAASREFDANLTLSTKDRPGWLADMLRATEMLYFNRWGYWLRTLSEDRLIGPIPQIATFYPYPRNSPVEKMFRNMENADYGSSGVFFKILDWILWGLGSPLADRFPDISLKVDRAWLKLFEVHHFYEKPADYFASMLSDAAGGKTNSARGYFPTPMHICEMKAKMIYGKQDWEKAALERFEEPCCGTGVMMLAASNYSLNMKGNDISLAAVKCTTINGWLYMPWVVFRPSGLALFGEEPVFKKKIEEQLETAMAMEKLRDKIAVFREVFERMDVRDGSPEVDSSSLVLDSQTE